MSNTSITHDRRTEEEKSLTLGFVVARDKALSGWGRAPRNSYLAVPVQCVLEIPIVFENLEYRKEMKNIRWIQGVKCKIRMKAGDHLSIAPYDPCGRYWRKYGFAPGC